jgi:hypothetical protein
MSKVLSTFSRRTQHTQEGIMAGQVRDGRGGVREGGRAGYLKGDRVRVWCARRDNDELPEVFSPQAWRVDDFMGDKIGVVPEIHRPSEFRTKGGGTDKMRIKFYVPPDQLACLQRGVSAGQNRQQGATAACQGARSGIAQSQPHAKPQHESAEPIPSLMVFRPIANAGSAITGFASRRSIGNLDQVT